MSGLSRRALENLLTGSRSKIAMIDADLTTMRGPWSEEKMFAQGYQTGRRAELETLVSILEVALVVAA